MAGTVTRIVIDSIVLHFSSKTRTLVPANGYYSKWHETYDGGSIVSKVDAAMVEVSSRKRVEQRERGGERVSTETR
jgi:hypothetical protein